MKINLPVVALVVANSLAGPFMAVCCSVVVNLLLSFRCPGANFYLCLLFLLVSTVGSCVSFERMLLPSRCGGGFVACHHHFCNRFH